MTAFGCHRGISLGEVDRRWPDYFPRLAMQIHPGGRFSNVRQLVLQDQLEEAGLLERIVKRAAELKIADQMKTFAREESGAKASMHKDLRALHEVNLAQFREEGVGDSVVQMQSVPGPRIANKQK